MMRRLITILSALICAIFLMAAGCEGTTAEQACQPYGGVHEVGEDEGTCNKRVDGDRVRIENEDGAGWEVDDVD